MELIRYTILVRTVDTDVVVILFSEFSNMRSINHKIKVMGKLEWESIFAFFLSKVSASNSVNKRVCHFHSFMVLLAVTGISVRGRTSIPDPADDVPSFQTFSPDF